MVEFDLSCFVDIGKWLFETGKSVFELANFNFGDYTINGWSLLLGIAILSVLAWFLGKIFA